MKTLEHRLKKKGWNKKEIDKAAKILDKAKKRKSEFLNVPKEIMIFIALALAIAGNIAVSMFLVPVVIVLDSSALFYIIIFVLALAMGIVFVALVEQIENIEKKMHVLFATIVPITALINFYFIVISSNKVIEQLQLLKLHQDPMIISIVYTVTFLLPYLYTLRQGE